MKKIILILTMVAAGWSAAAQFREVPLLREEVRYIPPGGCSVPCRWSGFAICKNILESKKRMR